MSNRDRIYIRDLRMRCIIGLNDWEREKEQDVIINITLDTDLAAAGASDDIEDTVNYRALKEQIIAHVEQSRCNLIEALAEQIAALCLKHERIAAARVMIDKPGALRFARSVAVEVVREK